MSVCLITASGSRQWTIPKGTIDSGFTPEEAALREAWEEAGLGGTIVGESIGTYTYEKWNRVLTVAVYLMEVGTVADTWDEQDVRDRRWLGPDKAVKALGDHPALDLMQRALDRLRP